MKEALFYEKLSDNVVHCLLCPQSCTINEGRQGNCKVRKNFTGRLFSENYGRLTATNEDPIEKKPLYHFYPGTRIFSIGSAGCNLHCRFCQNYEISQSTIDELHPYDYTPQEIVEAALKKSNNTGIAYTYNEPTVFFEFMIDTAKLAKEKNLKNIVVSNGFINREPLEKLVEYIDAFNIDLKSFSEAFYQEVSGGSLSPVLETLKFIRSQNKHLEITFLLVPGLNDDKTEFEKMTEWIAAELGKDTVLHISRYFPRYKLSSPPTPESSMMEFYELASDNLRFVYLGNISDETGHDTVCPGCHETVIQRNGYSTDAFGLDEKGHCIYCGRFIAQR